jgi:hypothetical protein
MLPKFVAFLQPRIIWAAENFIWAKERAKELQTNHFSLPFVPLQMPLMTSN